MSSCSRRNDRNFDFSLLNFLTNSRLSSAIFQTLKPKAGLMWNMYLHAQILTMKHWYLTAGNNMDGHRNCVKYPKKICYV